jgi:ribosomal protein S18 acetylase RimI-like enzyme
MNRVRQEDSSPLEFLKLTPEWEGPLADFFHALRGAGDESNFHPHPLDAGSANKLTSYTGRDLYYIAVAGGRVLGYGMLRGWDEGYAIPSLGIAIHPDARGKGLGKALMGFLHCAARQKGANRIRLKVYPQNTASLNLYGSLGYKFETSDGGQLVGYLDLAHR